MQFFVDGWGCVLSLLFAWGQTMMEVMKRMVTSLKRPHARTAIVCAPDPAAGRHPPTPAPETPGHPQARLGQSPVGSLLLSPGSWCTRCCRALQESISQSCVRSGRSVVWLLVTFSRRTYATPTSRAPVPAGDHRHPEPPQETLTPTSVSVSVGPPGPGAHKVCLSRLSISAGMGFDLNTSLPLLLSAGASPLPLDVGHPLTAAPVPTVLLGCLLSATAPDLDVGCGGPMVMVRKVSLILRAGCFPP